MQSTESGIYCLQGNVESSVHSKKRGKIHFDTFLKRYSTFPVKGRFVMVVQPPLVCIDPNTRAPVRCTSCGWSSNKFGLNYAAVRPYCYLCLDIYAIYRHDPDSMPKCLRNSGCKITTRYSKRRIACVICRMRPIFNEGIEEFDESSAEQVCYFKLP